MDSRHRPRHPPPPSFGAGAGPGGRDDFWTEAATAALIEAWGERYLQLNRGSLRQKDWEDVAAAVNDGLAEAGKAPRTDAQCKNRMDTLKKKYKNEKARLGLSQWPFFPQLDVLLGSSSSPSTGPHAVGGTVADGIKKPNPAPRIPSGIPHPRTSKPHPSLASIKNAIPIPAAPVHSGSFIRPRRMNSPESTESSQGGGRHLDDGNDDDEEDNVEDDGRDDGEEQRRNGLFNAVVGRKRPRSSSLRGNRGASNGGGSGFGGNRGGGGNSAGSGLGKDRPFTELASVIMRFVEVYERVESSKQQQMLEIDRRWMEFTKELEFQKMKMFMEAQLEIEKMKRPKNIPGFGKKL